MASNKNIPQKGQGANEPDKKQPIQSDAADVDWMIISDISTRIGGSLDIQSLPNQSPARSSYSPVSSNESAENDLEDLEWLQSLGLDEPIERSPSPKNTPNPSGSDSHGNNAIDNDDVGNIDWLIVTDIKTRMDDSDIKAKATPSYHNIAQPQTTLQPSTDNIMDSLDDDLGLDGFDFLENSDFSDLDSLGLDTSDPLSIDELQNESDYNTEGEIQGLAELLDDKDDSSFDLSASGNDNDWDSISGILGGNVNESFRTPSLDIANESFEISTQVPDVFETTEDYYDNADLIPDQLPETNYSEDLENLLVDDLGFSDEVQPNQLVEDFAIQNELQNEQDMEQNLSFEEFKVGNLEIENVNDLDEGFEIEADEEIWSNTSSSNDFKSTDESFDNVFTNDWGQISDNAIAESTINDNDSVWDSTSSIDSDLVSSTSIDNAFGTFEDWESASQIAQSEEEYVDFELPHLSTSEVGEYTEFDLPSLDDSNIETIEPAFNSAFNLETESTFEQPFEHLPNETKVEISNDENWNVELESDEISNISDAISNDWVTESEDEIVVDNSLDDGTDWSASLEAEIGVGNDVVWEDALGVETEEHLQATDESSEMIDDDLLSLDSDLAEQSFTEDIDFSNNLDDSVPPSPDWEILSESTAEQVTDSDFSSYDDSLASKQIIDSEYVDAFANYADVFDDDVAPAVDNSTQIDWNIGTETSISDITDNPDDLESMLDDNFDLAAFDEDSLPNITLSDANLVSIPTTLTPNRISPLSSPEDTFSKSTLSPSINPINSVVSASDPFEDALTNDLINDSYEDLINDSYEIDLHEEALANDLLNGYTSEIDVFEDIVSAQEKISSTSSNLASSANFALETNDSDFLDDFDLDSIDPITGGDFDSGFVSAPISTGLTPPPPPIAPTPPNLPPLPKQEPTAPSLNPPPPPFLPPLPPRRNPTQGSTVANTPYPVAKSGTPSQPQNRTGKRNEEDSFNQFHSQSDQHRHRKPNISIDEGWSELLDADTVLSGGRSSTGSSYSDISSTMPSSAGRVTQGKDRNSSGIPKRKESTLPDFNDLGLEIHDDNTDWSGLLDSGDLSDSITTISPQNTQLPSQVRSNPVVPSRSDMSGISETREIPRDRRKPISGFGDSTQARMGATPDQVDFNRFTEDNYSGYDYEQPAPPPAVNPSKTKLTMPSISLESLWQDYLKIPAIGLGAIVGAILLYSLLNKPVFDLGLRWGLFKDARGKDFTNTDFKGAKLDNVDFSKAILTGAKMQDASLVGANFQEANLDGVNFTNANLSRARLIQSSVIWSEFKNAQMNLVDLAGSDLTRSNFVGAKMEGANLKDSKIGAQGTEKATRFSATTLLAWQIVNEPREGRNLASQDLSGLNLSFTSLRRANLSNVKLNYTDMTNTDLSGANLTGGQINGANWSGAKLNGINFTGVIFDKNKLPKTDEETVCPNGKKGPCKF